MTWTLTRTFAYLIVILATLAMAEPAQQNLIKDVTAVRATVPGTPTPEQIGKMLNEIAWRNRTDGWGLSRKPGGNRCPSPVGDIACDILHHRPTNQLFDVFIDAGGATTPTWSHAEYHGDPVGRPWLAPVDPGTTPPPPPPPVCSYPDVRPDLMRCTNELQTLSSQHTQTQHELIAARERVQVVEQERDTIRAELETLKNKPAPRCTASVFGIRIPCRVITE